jgi:hypothetical protein
MPTSNADRLNAMLEHEHPFAYKGMTRVGATDSDVIYACITCGGSYSALRCVATNARGARCGQPAIRFHTTCWPHRGQEPRS